jgi:hypothetical protein
MLEKTVVAIKADKAKTIELINKGEGVFLDRDLYPFCANVDDGKTHRGWQPKRETVDWHGRQSFKGRDRQGIRRGTLCRWTEIGWRIYGGQLYVCETGTRQDAGAENQLRHENRRYLLRSRLLQIGSL